MSEAPPVAPVARPLARLHDLLVARAPGLSPAQWEAVLSPTRTALSRPGVRTHASLARPLAEWSGLSPEELERCDDLFDLLQLAIDAADNVGDWQQDLADGRAPDRAYGGLGPAVLACVPPLAVGLVVDLLHTGFGPTRSGASAARRVLATLSVMAAGQGEAAGSAAKVEAVSATQGLLLCLPCWLCEGDDRVTQRLGDAENWARLFGRTWELRQLAEEGVADAPWRLARAMATLRLFWPRWGPFLRGGPLAKEVLLEPGMS